MHLPVMEKTPAQLPSRGLHTAHSPDLQDEGGMVYGTFVPLLSLLSPKTQHLISTSPLPPSFGSAATNILISSFAGVPLLSHSAFITQTHCYHDEYFYELINVSALIGQMDMTYPKKFIGFWLAYTLPTIVFLLCPIILYLGQSLYSSPPTGSVLVTALHLW
ncbi:hypothetical protein BDZ97DRAFT_1929170 [Flammula alnicola]|nr:hypothetical protein BDZ97DRAFT_1929170 [Flammula alnicola]